MWTARAETWGGAGAKRALAVWTRQDRLGVASWGLGLGAREGEAFLGDFLGDFLTGLAADELRDSRRARERVSGMISARLSHPIDH